MTSEPEKPKKPVGGSIRTVDLSTDPAQRVLALCGMVAPASILLSALVLAMLTPNYSHAANTLSELGAQGAPYATYFNAVMIVAGLLIVAFAVGLHRDIGGGNGSTKGPGLVAAFGLFATVGTGATPLDLESTAPINLIHIGFVLIGFLSLAAGMYVVSFRMATDSRWDGYARITRWWSVLLLLLFSGWFVALFAVPLEPGESPNGALQRPFVVWTLLWIELTAIKLFSRR
ncbi:MULTISPECIES: DUF998 domain-containing protein [Natrialbaceae]|uniref:DUF998 domain-containing protein n=1 Tax=Natrialbaceae TaxID=1644061 RepID=UPI00207C7F4E|nr:DUF998 domain-containing protein [Natronococcus sp. CG52]